MIIIEQILGNIGDREWAARLGSATVEPLALDHWEAQKNRFRKKTADGTDVAVSLDRGAFLRDGDVLLWDELRARAVVAQISLRDVMVIHLDGLASLSPAIAARTCVELGHALGNQHWPALVKGDRVFVPLTVDRKVMASVMNTHRFEDIRYEFVPGGDIVPYLAPHESRRLFGGAEGPVHTHTHDRYVAIDPATGRAHGRPPVRAFIPRIPTPTADNEPVGPLRGRRTAQYEGGVMTTGDDSAASPPMSAAGPPQGASSAPGGAAQRREPQAWGDHTNAVHLARLLQFGDSVFPIGGFAFSGGLESAVQKRVVTDAATLLAFTRTAVEQASRGDGVGLICAHRAAVAEDLEELMRIDARVYARKLSGETRTMSVRMGKKFTEMGAQVTGSPALQTWRARVETGATPGCYPVTLAVNFAAQGLSARDAFVVHQYGVSAMILSAALRLMRVSHVDTQQMLYALNGDVELAYRTAAAATLSDMAGFAPLTEILASVHVKAHVRLFMN